MFIHRAEPTQSSIAKHFLECGCWLINSRVLINMKLTLLWVWFIFTWPICFVLSTSMRKPKLTCTTCFPAEMTLQGVELRADLGAFK